MWIVKLCSSCGCLIAIVLLMRTKKKGSEERYQEKAAETEIQQAGKQVRRNKLF